jgi:hypothetical protein
MRLPDFLSFVFVRMKKWLLVFAFVSLYFPLKASHIVGGEFELRYISGNTYRLTLILYFDSINGAPGARDPSAMVRFFRKRDNAIVLLSPGNANSDRLFLAFVPPQSHVNYTNKDCASEDLVTNKLVYTATVELLPSVFNDREGYYVSWERCCRNYSITNIYSTFQPGPGIYAGQTFYLEFPPVVKNGAPFINNSPRLFPPLSDYGCPYTPYYVDFAGIDDDGDSLVYSMVAPLNTHSADALPPPVPPSTASLPRPGPYPEVTWKPGFGLTNIMSGVTNMEISPDGFLTITPRDVGLYVFAVRCEEFRDGVKIGEVRRDFQMLVVQEGGCPDIVNPPKPSIVGKGPTDPAFGTTGQLSVSYLNTVPVGERCFEVKVSDPSTLRPDEGNQENIRIAAIPLDFKKNINEILPAVKTKFLQNGEEAFFEICFPQVCPYTATGTFQVGIVAYDDACALPLTDTLRVTVFIEPPVNHQPEFLTSTDIVEVIEEGEAVQQWPIQVTDADGDVIQYRLVAKGFALESVGMSFTGPRVGAETGSVNKTLSWDPKCDLYDFTQKTNFELYFIVDDVDDCPSNKPDTTFFNLSITDFSQITPPVIGNSVLSDADTLEFTYKIHDDPLVFGVTGEDVDNAPLLLRGFGLGFNAGAYGVSFPPDFEQGSVASQFSWEITCDSIDLEARSTFAFQLEVVDSLNKCGFYHADTLHLIVHVEPPDEKEFIPPNVFTPNGDDKNAFFAMVEYDEDSGEFVSILPEDNCTGVFVSIQIYDRWGKQVYESHDRDFRWFAPNMPVGVYFYYLRYTHRDYKGIVSLRL